MKEITIDIHNLSEDCPANTDMECKYGISVMGNEFGLSAPCKSKEDIIQTGRNYIKSEIEWYKDQLKIVNLTNSTPLDITKADFEGNNKLGQWLGA